MTAPATPCCPAAAATGRTPPPAAVRARDVLASEWIKLWSVRSTYATLSIAAVLAVGLSALGTYLTAAAAAHPPPGSGPCPTRSR